MIDLNTIRKMFAEHLGANAEGRFSFDQALMEVAKFCYNAGMEEGRACTITESTNAIQSMDLDFECRCGSRDVESAVQDAIAQNLRSSIMESPSMTQQGSSLTWRFNPETSKDFRYLGESLQNTQEYFAEWLKSIGASMVAPRTSGSGQEDQ